MFNNKKTKSIQQNQVNKSQKLFAPLNSQEQRAISGGYGRKGGAGGGWYSP